METIGHPDQQEGPIESVVERMQRLQREIVDSGLVPIEDALRVKSEQQLRDEEVVNPTSKRPVSEVAANVHEIAERTKRIINGEED